MTIRRMLHAPRTVLKMYPDPRQDLKCSVQRTLGNMKRHKPWKLSSPRFEPTLHRVEKNRLL